jgi:hypothetical protein
MNPGTIQGHFRQSRLAALLVVPLLVLGLMLPASVGAAGTVSENFDGVTAPALPTDWISTFGAQCVNTIPWRTVTSNVDTAPNSAFINDPNCIGDVRLTSPSIPIAGAGSQLTFRNRYQVENGFDGGILEIAIGGGSFTEILAAGGSFAAGGYNGTISVNFGSPIAGRQAWTGNSAGGYITTVVNLPAAAVGQSIQLRWRFATDSSVSGQGWNVDTIEVTEVGVDEMPPEFSNVPTEVTQQVTTGTGGAVVTYTAPSAEDAVDGSVPVTCTPASGSTFPLGQSVVTCSAMDNAGNIATTTFNVYVVYQFTGFFQPIDNQPTSNSVKAGQSVPVKFSLNGNQTLNIFAADFPASKQVNCTSGAPIDALETIDTPGASGLTYDSSTNQYHYVWKTQSSWGSQCRILVVRFKDGNEYTALFQFKK